MKRALVLSGGGLFGAWQVGAWSVLRDHFQPDVVIGVSIGALNGWAIAGGVEPGELAERWRKVAAGGRLRFRLPLNPLDGVVEPAQIHGWIREIHEAYRPRTQYYLVMTDLLRVQPKLVEGSHVHWRHLAASCALLGLLPLQRIDRVLYTDGGFPRSLPLWAAAHCHATETIALNVMPKMPWPVRAALKPLVRINRRPDPDRDRTAVLAPSRSLGSWKYGLMWRGARIEDWIRQGEEDARAALHTGNISFL